MATFGQVQSRINSDYLNRGGDFTTETQHAIQAAVRHYEYQRFPHNETATAIATVASVGYVALPSNFLILDDLYITVNGENLLLDRQSPRRIRALNVSLTTSQPTDYAVNQNRIELALIPNAVYALPLYYIKQLPALSANTDTNAWITGAWEDVITYHATKLMWANVLRKQENALVYAALEKQAFDVVESHGEQFTSGKIVPTRF